MPRIADELRELVATSPERKKQQRKDIRESHFRAIISNFHAEARRTATSGHTYCDTYATASNDGYYYTSDIDSAKSMMNDIRNFLARENFTEIVVQIELYRNTEYRIKLYASWGEAKQHSQVRQEKETSLASAHNLRSISNDTIARLPKREDAIAKYALKEVKSIISKCKDRAEKGGFDCEATVYWHIFDRPSHESSNLNWFERLKAKRIILNSLRDEGFFVTRAHDRTSAYDIKVRW